MNRLVRWISKDDGMELLTEREKKRAVFSYTLFIVMMACFIVAFIWFLVGTPDRTTSLLALWVTSMIAMGGAIVGLLKIQTGRLDRELQELKKKGNTNGND